ncbi:MAG: hypothetical protein HY063_14750 [Bacteroidetes bacterium]|nr:hypothetical protein [Bacteroidota bacterium]
MKKIISACGLLFSVYGGFSQTDSTKKPAALTEPTDTGHAGYVVPGLDTTHKGITDMGVAVAPAMLFYRVKPGNTTVQYVTITNDTYKKNKFKLTFSDFTMSDAGAIEQIPIGQNGEYGLTKWINVAPNYIELQPGEKKKLPLPFRCPITMPPTARFARC